MFIFIYYFYLVIETIYTWIVPLIEVQYIYLRYRRRDLWPKCFSLIPIRSYLLLYIIEHQLTGVELAAVRGQVKDSNSVNTEHEIHNFGCFFREMDARVIHNEHVTRELEIALNCMSHIGKKIKLCVWFIAKI